MDAEKERKAIDRLRAFVPPDGEPYYLCYSGGKDSDCIRILADLAGVPHEIHHNLTTVDAPETVRYIKSIPGCIIHRPERSMWRLIVDHKYPPTRLARYCCEELKERGGQGRMKVTGVRAAESRARRDTGALAKILGKEKTVQRAAEETGADYRVSPKGGLLLNFDNPPTQKLVHQCMRTTSTMLQPIIDWTTEDVWDFLHHYGCESNPLYKGGENADRVHRMSYGGRQAAEAGLRKVAEVPRKLRPRLRQDARRAEGRRTTRAGNMARRRARPAVVGRRRSDAAEFF